MIELTKDMAHVILGALDVADGEMLTGVIGYGPHCGPGGLDYAQACASLVRQIKASYPELVAAYRAEENAERDLAAWIERNKAQATERQA